MILANVINLYSSSSEPSPRLTKIINKINRYIALIDSSMLCQQLGYQLASNCMVLCDPELNVGLNTPGGNTGVATRGRGAWTPVGVNGQPPSAYVFGHEDARELAIKGHEIALKVKEGFSGIAQEMYKVCERPRSSIVVNKVEWNRSPHLPKMICSSYMSHLILPTVRSLSLCD